MKKQSQKLTLVFNLKAKVGKAISDRADSVPGEQQRVGFNVRSAHTNVNFSVWC